MEVRLKIDDRERNVIEKINMEFEQPYLYKNTQGIISHTVERLQAGDYIICLYRDDECTPLAIIERKTLADYSSSFKDGRLENLEKLLQFRESSKCMIFYLIEGDLCPKPETEYAHIKYGVIRASIMNLQINYGIQIIRTKNKSATAAELKFICEMFLRAFSKPECEIYKKYISNESQEIIKGGYEAAVSKAKLSPEEEFNRSQVAGWATLKGISAATASYIIKDYSFADWILGKNKNIEEFKVAGRKNNIVLNYFRRNPTDEEMQNILSCVRGFSKKTMMQILEKVRYEEFLGEYKEVRYGEKNTKLTEKKWQSVQNYLLNKFEN